MAQPILLCDCAGMDNDCWLECRKHGPNGDIEYTVGGSDVATIFGISPWTTPLELWMIKKGRTKPKALQGINSLLQAQIKKNEEAIEAHSVRIAELMKTHEHGILETTTDKLLVDFVTKTTRRVNSDFLKKNHPSIYQDALKTTESQKVKVTIQPV